MGSTQEKNYYELLGVERNATEEQIRASYKEIARVFHPDSNFFSEIIQDQVDADEIALFKIITAAYSTLVDQKKRVEYDRTLPPVLRDWDSEPESSGPQILKSNEAVNFYTNLKRDNKLNPRGAFGSGAYQPPKFEYEDESDDGEPVMLKSVAQMVHERGILFRLKTLFGIR